VSRYQIGKTNLDFTEVRDSEWQWHQLGHMQVCISLQTDNHASAPPATTLVFLQAGCPSCCPTNSVKALKAEKKPLTGVIVVVGLMVCFNRGDKYHEFYFIQIQSLIQYPGGYLCHYTIEHTDLHCVSEKNKTPNSCP